MLSVVIAPPESSQLEKRIVDYRERRGRVVIISSERSLRVTDMSLIAASRGMNPRETLKGIYVSRAFNMFQAENLMSEAGARAAMDLRADILLAIDLHELFLSEENFADSARRFSQSVWRMKQSARDLTCELIFRSMVARGSKGLLGSAVSAADEFEELSSADVHELSPVPLSSAPPSLNLRVLMQ